MQIFDTRPLTYRFPGLLEKISTSSDGPGLFASLKLCQLRIPIAHALHFNLQINKLTKSESFGNASEYALLSSSRCIRGKGRSKEMRKIEKNKQTTKYIGRVFSLLHCT